MSKYNHIKSIPIESIPKDEIYTAIKEWAEGDESMERFLIACYEKGIETTDCHAGAGPYIGFRYKQGDKHFEKMFDTIEKIIGSQILLTVDGGNPYSGPDWYEPGISLGFDAKYKDEADEKIDKLTEIIEKENLNMTSHPLIDLLDFFLGKESGLLFRFRHEEDDNYVFQIESRAITEERYKYYDSIFTSLGMKESREGYPPETKMRKWIIKSNSLSEIKDQIASISKNVISRYDLPPETEEENMLSFIILAKHKKRKLSQEKFEKWLAEQKEILFAPVRKK